MKTAEEMILEIQELPPAERQKAENFIHEDEEYVEEENYSDEDMALLNQLQEDAENRVNMSGLLFW